MFILIIALFFLLSISVQQTPIDFTDLQSITAHNAAQLKQIASLGMGRGGMPYWSADGQIVYYPTTAGMWEYRLCVRQPGYDGSILGYTKMRLSVRMASAGHFL